MSKVLRHAYAIVVDNFNHLRSLLGTAQAVDYPRMFENTGKAKNSSTGSGFVLTDFCIDVENAVRHTLKGDDLKFFYDFIIDKPLNTTHLTDSYMRLQDRLGRVFMARGLYPLQRYFSVVKK